MVCIVFQRLVDEGSLCALTVPMATDNIYIYIYICVCVCVCVHTYIHTCIFRERERDNHLYCMFVSASHGRWFPLRADRSDGDRHHIYIYEYMYI